MEGLVESVTTLGHGFGTDSDTDVNRAFGNLVGDVLHGFEARGTESVDAVGTGGMGEASSEHGSSDDVGGFAIGNLSKG